MSDLVVEILDFDWVRKAVTPAVIEATVTDELGAVGDGEITIPATDAAVYYIPDPDEERNNEARFRLYEDGALKFAGVVDATRSRLSSDDQFTFGGKQRGILLGQRNVGRRDFNAWNVQPLFEELLRDNIGKAPMATVISSSSYHNLHPPVNAITGDIAQGQYWAATISGSSHIVIDLGSQQQIDGIRVIPPYWDQRWYKFTAETSTDNSSYTSQGSKTDVLPLSDKGKFFSTDVVARYVRVIVSDSTDAIGRLAGVMVYQKLAEVGPDTSYAFPWIENDDSGNIDVTGNVQRIIEQGSFNGDGVLGNSFVSRLVDGSAALTHRFRGTANSVVMTQGQSGGTAGISIEVDGFSMGSYTVLADTYQVVPFSIDNLADGLHTMKVTRVSGTPQIDYFTGMYDTSYRPLRDDDTAIGYTGTWKSTDNSSYTNFVAHRSQVSGSSFLYDFKGDAVKVIGTTGPNMGKADFYIDGFLEETVDLYSNPALYQQEIFVWSGSYTDHTLRGVVLGTKNVNSSGSFVDIDGLEGNFTHIIYLRSFYENNLRLITRLSEISNTWLRFNHDGSIDLLGQVGEYSNTIIREGENEGGTLINADKNLDYAETASAVLALVTGPDDYPIKAFVLDKNAVDRMGLKVRKMEQADAQDAYLLTRQAWTELQDHVSPVKRYTAEYDDSEVGDIDVGDTTILYSPKLGLSGTDRVRVGRKITTYSPD